MLSEMDETLEQLSEDIQDDGEMDLDTKDVDYKAQVDAHLEREDAEEDELMEEEAGDDDTTVHIVKQSTINEVVKDVKALGGNVEKNGIIGPVEVVYGVHLNLS